MISLSFFTSNGTPMTEIVTPQDLSQQASEAYQMGDFDQAASQFCAAAEAFERAGKALDAAEMKNNASVCYLQSGRNQESYNIVAGTYKIFAENNDTRRKALALGNEAAALEALGRRDEAIQLYNQSAQAFLEIGDEESHSLVFATLAKLQMTSGKITDGILTMGTSLAEVKSPTMRQRFMKFLYSTLARLLRVRI
ncbi:MAG TPA: hypothetical protein VFM46_04240 [Pseudomonadales bacterium]|nr:hypothetical protein [Pseudomonadales bacterium]